MALRDSSLTTLTRCKTALGVSGSTDDTKLERMIDAASSWIESQTNRKLKARNYNGYNASGHGSTFDYDPADAGTDIVASDDFIYFDGDRASNDEYGRGQFFLPQFPILTVSGSNRNQVNHANALTFTLYTLSDRGSGVSGNEEWDTLTQFDDYVLDQTNGVIRLLGGAFVPGVRNYRVKCTSGINYGTAQPYVPDDLEQLCIELVKLIYKDRKGLQSESIGTWSRSFNALAKDPFIEDTLARYTRYSL